MKRSRRRKCLHCGELFKPDARNRHHQRYCPASACRRASKAASQRRWLAKPDNHDYFRDPAHIRRVQAWRQAHPKYWQREASQTPSPLQEDCIGQPVDLEQETATLAATALQDLWLSQPLVLVGLIANLTGSALQEDIARTGRQLEQLGRDILTTGEPDGQNDSAR